MSEIVLEEGRRLTLPTETAKYLGLEAGQRLIIAAHEGQHILHAARPDARRAYVEVTTRCNLNCTVCMRQVWRDAPGEMTWGAFKEVIQGLREFPKLERLTLGGFGEPLLHPRLPEMLELAATLGVRLTVTTNGLLLDEETTRLLLKAGVDQVVVSLDTAHAQAHQLSLIKGGQELVLRNARRLMRLAEGRPWPPINMGLEFVATRSNRGELAHLRETARDLGASFVLVSNLLPHTPEMANETLYDSDQPISLPLSWPVRDRGAIVWGRMDLPRMKWGAWRRCRFVEDQAMVIGSDGGVSPCYGLMHSYPYYIYGRVKNVTRYVLGQVGKQSLADIWNSEEYVRFRAKVRDFRFTSCVDCGLACTFAEDNEDCRGNVPSCADCLWAQDIVRCP
jgi:tungsten cofactor oxidoreducase radical SAM maturase